jgi:hypothetical protein
MYERERELTWKSETIDGAGHCDDERRETLGKKKGRRRVEWNENGACV